jgi:hypothetical protein
MMRMDKLVRQCDMEVMKMAMLKHEETFRQQVNLTEINPINYLLLVVNYWPLQIS